MDVNTPLQLFAGLSAQQFMRRHWQKKPLLVRQAFPDFKPLLSRAGLFALAAQEGVQARLVQQKAKSWSLAHGPFKKKALPALSAPGWTLLVQGVDLHLDAAHNLLQQFRFVPDARLDDLMISYASAGGGVGPHFDSYDVFLLQASGQRRWKIGRQKDLSLRADVPLKVLQHFEPEEEFVLSAGDMLYLPPRWAHDGVAVGADECMTYSIGFRAPSVAELAHGLLTRMADEVDDEDPQAARLYADPKQDAASEPAQIPSDLSEFARQALLRAANDPDAFALSLGEMLTEPKPDVWFDAQQQPWRAGAGVLLDRRTRMMFDAQHIFINGEALRAAGRDAALMRRLANARRLSTKELAKASLAAQNCLQQWLVQGWLHHD
jgi:50S ribosomal protein L16 3-hydroxylase